MPRHQRALTPLLHRRRRRRPRGRRPHDAVRDPRGRPVPSRCWTSPPRRARGWTEPAAGAWSPALPARPGRPSRRRELAARHRLSRRPAQPRRDESARATTSSSPIARRWRARFRWSASTCSRRSAASILGADFWRRFAAIDNVVAIKVAPFNRYRTLDVLRGVAAAGARGRIALYTGNDDHIVLDLITPFDLRDRGVDHAALFQRRPARPLVGMDRRAPSSSSRRCQGRARHGRDARGSARARCPRHRLQQRVLRRRQRLPRLHRRLPRSPAPAGPARGHLVPRSRRGPQPRPDRGDRPRLHEHADLSDDDFVGANLQKWLA